MKPIKTSEISANSSKIRKKVRKVKVVSNKALDYYVPPINVTAESVDQIYPLDKIFTPEQYEAIYNEMTEKEFQLEFSKGVSAMYDSNTFTKEQTVLAMFLSGLHKLYKYLCDTRKRLPKKFTPSYSSKTLNQYILQNYSITTGKSYDRGFRTIGYALVLSMLINNYRINLQEFAEDFDVDPKIVLRVCDTTGATVQIVHGKRMLVLRLPLTPRKFAKTKTIDKTET